MPQALVSLDIPMQERSLQVSLLELDSPWPSQAPIEQVLTALEGIGLELSRMSTDLELSWRPYARTAAAQAVWQGVENRTSVIMSSADGNRRASVARFDRQPKQGPATHRNTVTFTLDAYKVADWGLARIEAAIATLASALPGFTASTASACDPVRFPALFEVLQPPAPLKQSAWLHVLSPRLVARLGGEARLLNGPLRCERRADGGLWVWSYDDPLRYDNEAAIEGMRVFSQLLRAGT